MEANQQDSFFPSYAQRDYQSLFLFSPPSMKLWDMPWSVVKSNGLEPAGPLKTDSYGATRSIRVVSFCRHSTLGTSSEENRFCPDSSVTLKISPL